MPSWKKPTNYQVDRAIAQLTKKQHYRYFFQKLENPEWITPLYKRGYFQNPPDIDYNEKDGTIGFPAWPESEYLPRMAVHKPIEVVNIFIKMKGTENISVLRDMISSAVNMPADISVRLLQKIIASIESKYFKHSYFHEELGELIVKWSHDGHVAESLKLSRNLLEILPDPEIKEKSHVEDSFLKEMLSFPRPISKLQKRVYVQIIKIYFIQIVNIAKIDAINLLCELLETEIKFSRRQGEKKELDYSTIWRPFIDDNDEKYKTRYGDILIDVIRDSLQILVSENKVEIGKLVEELESRRYSIFKRLSLYLVAKYPENNMELTIQKCMDKDIFNDSSVRIEYKMLLKNGFRLLEETQKSEILKLIDNGPDLEGYKYRYEKSTGNSLMEDELNKYKRKWQYGWLIVTGRENLRNSWVEIFDKYKEEFGGEEDQPVLTGGWVGPASPRSVDDLSKMTIDDIVEFLKMWAPKETEYDLAPEGLGRILSEVVAERYEEFAEYALKLRDTDATYIRSIIKGLADATKKGRAFMWEKVIELCNWALEQPRDIEREEKLNDYDADPHWGWTYKNMATLFSNAFDKNLIGVKHRETVWKILERLSNDPDPTPDDENVYGPPNMDAFTYSINTTRGEAMHTIVRYTKWVKQKYDKFQRDSAFSFDIIPEVRELLDKHLDVGEDPSLAIRSVYGMWFNNLYLLDSQWIVENVSRIFPLDETQINYFRSAWYAFITINNPRKDIYNILKDQYMFAITNETHKEPGEWSLGNPNERLAEHLMELYWQGEIEYEDEIFNQFYQNELPEVNKHALYFVGMCLSNTPGDVQNNIMERIKMLWDNRLQYYRENSDVTPVELEAIGKWFVSGKFDDEWVIRQLNEVLKLNKKVDTEREVINKLSELASTYPLVCVACLRLMIEGDREGWSVLLWKEDIRKLLTITMKITDDKVKEESIILIHYIGSRGYMEFKDLLNI